MIVIVGAVADLFSNICKGTLGSQWLERKVIFQTNMEDCAIYDEAATAS